MKRQVVITGLGVISTLGRDTDSFWQACLAGKSNIAPIPDHWREYAEFRSSIWSPLGTIDFQALGFSRMERMQFDPVTLMAAAASGQALCQAGMTVELADRRANRFHIAELDGESTGVFMGTGIGGASSFMANHTQHLMCGVRRDLHLAAKEVVDGQKQKFGDVLKRMEHIPRFNPFVVSMLMPNAVAAYTGIKYSLGGENSTSTLACASSTVAIGKAWQAIAEGRINCALAGGSEYLSDAHGSIFQGFDACRTLVRDCAIPDQANRPFDADRSGFLFSEGGAAVLCLESMDHALARGVQPIALVEGFAESFDASSMMIPAPEGKAIEAMTRQLLDAAGHTPGEVDYINTHGTGTQGNDGCESAMIERVFGSKVHVNSSKSLLGHTLGASGALEAVVTALSLQEQRTHASLNIKQPIANLNFVKTAESIPVNLAISQSFGFGGHNATLLLSRCK